MTARSHPADAQGTGQAHLLRGGLTNYANQATTFVVWFLVTPYVLGRLGADRYGLWMLVASVVQWGLLLDLGLGRAVTKYVAEHRVRAAAAEVRAVVGSAFRISALLGLLVLVLAALLAPSFPRLFHVLGADQDTAVWLVLLMGAGVALGLPGAVSRAVLHGLHRFDLDNVVSMAGTVGMAGSCVVVLALGGTLLPMVAAATAVGVGTHGLRLWLVQRTAHELRGGLFRGRGAGRPLLAFGSPLFAANVAGQLQSRSDEILIGAFLPVGLVTPYVLARGLGEVGQRLADQLVRLIVPLASELDASRDQARLRALYVTSTRIASAICLGVGTTLGMLAEPLLRAWVGAEVAQHARLVVLLTIASVIDTSQWPAGATLQGMARHRPLAALSVVGAVAKVGLALALIEPLGLTGVAMATLLPTAVVCLGLVMPYAMRVLGAGARETALRGLGPALLPVVPAVAVLWWLRPSAETSTLPVVGMVAALGLAVYAASYWLLVPEGPERAASREAVRRVGGAIRSVFQGRRP